MVRLKDVGKIITGNTPKTSEKENYESNDICFVKPSDIESDGISYIEETENFIAECAREKARILPVNSVLVTCIGIIGKIGINKVECAFNQQINAIVPNEEICLAQYLAYAIKSKKFLLQDIANAPVVPILNKTQFADVEIKIVDLKEQERIVHRLAKVEALIDQRKQQFQKLDELVKARFVEMFGDPVSNPYGYEKVVLSELADIKIGPFGSLLHKEDYVENGHALVNPSHIVEGRVVPDNKLTISEEKYSELYPYHLKNGDVVMGRRGEMGRCAVVDCDGYLCGTGSLLIRTKGEVTADYIQKSISFPSFKKSIEDMAVGQTMSNLNVPIVSKLQLIKPPIEVQNDYYEFVAKIDKSKLSVQNSLDKLETLKKALMQKYFG